MPKNPDRIISFLKHLNLESDIRAYEVRIGIQKIAFILEQMGAPINYDFELRKEGPYSKDLAKDYYDNQNKFANFLTEYEITNSDKEILDRYLMIMNAERAALEEVSTILFKKLQYGDFAYVVAKIKVIQPNLSENDIMHAQNKAKQLLFKNEFLTSDLISEFQLWERASSAPI